jgi:predicted dehydrogenase
MKKLKIALVGCGDVARFMAVGTKLNRKVKAVACVDINEERARSFAKRFRIPLVFTDYATMLEKAHPDAVYLAVPHHLHSPMIKTVLNSGCHVFCEKPITTNMDDALELCRLAQKTGLKVGVNYQYRYDTGCYALWHAAQNGDLGDIYYARCNLPWRRGAEYFTEAAWHASREASGGGTLLTQASHIIDIALLALGGEPAAALGVVGNRKFSTIEVEDTGMGIIEMKNKSLLSITSSMIATPEQPLSIELYASKGTAHYRGPLPSRIKFTGVSVKKERPRVRGIHAFFRSLEGFRRWVVDGERYLTPIEESLPILAAVTALYDSARSGKKEPVDERYTAVL